MKYYFIFFILLSITIISCDNREDYWLINDKSPELSIKRESDTAKSAFTNEINDSFKLSSKPYKIVLKWSDEEKLKPVYSFSFKTDSITLINESASVFFNNEGLSQVNFILTDCYGKKAEANLKVVTFKNLLPISNFVVTITAIHSPLEIQIDASSSFDQDSKFGGYISQYEYTINNLVNRTSKSKISYIFGSSGQKKIIVRVKDNDNAWSDEKILFITI